MKKTQNKQKYFSSNPELRRKEDLFSFFGILNFKIKKHNKVYKKEAFLKIKDQATDDYYQSLVREMIITKARDKFVLSIVKLSIEVNRRNNVKGLTAFKLSRVLALKGRVTLQVFRLLARGIRYNINKLYRNEGKQIAFLKLYIYKTYT